MASFNALQEMNRVKMMLETRTELAYTTKAKAENVKSFGMIFDQLLKVTTDSSER